jgi:hypothetical protein
MQSPWVRMLDMKRRSLARINGWHFRPPWQTYGRRSHCWRSRLGLIRQATMAKILVYDSHLVPLFVLVMHTRGAATYSATSLMICMGNCYNNCVPICLGPFEDQIRGGFPVLNLSGDLATDESRRLINGPRENNKVLYPVIHGDLGWLFIIMDFV